MNSGRARTARGESIRFPWKIYFRFVFAQVTVVAVTAIVAGVAGRTFFVRHVQRLGSNAEELRSLLITYDTAMTAALVFIIGALGLLSAWMGKRLLFPLGRLLVKASVESSPESLGGKAIEPLLEETYDELSDLENSLDRMKRDLAMKAERLDLERAEHATMMSAISDAILAVDLEGAPLFYNSRFAVLFGAPRAGEAGGRLWEIFREPEVLEAFAAASKKGRSASANFFHHDLEGLRKYFSVSVAPLKRGTGEVYGAVGSFHDVSELKRAEQIRIDFVANVSHELRTPLTAIKGYADTIAGDLVQGRPIESGFVDVILRHTARLMNLINDLLDLSSLESYADELQRSSLSTPEITEKVLRGYDSAFRAKGIHVQTKYDATVVFADPRRVDQILVNLIDNANKYSPSGGEVEVAWQSASTGDALLSVRNSGPGIPKEHHDRLFERFYRVDKARSREMGGTGLGLAIVKHIMQRHGGTVWVESGAGQGAKFVCRFPAEKELEA